ncbi:hypothetical protein D5086_000973, partial [Populus alba]
MVVEMIEGGDLRWRERLRSGCSGEKSAVKAVVLMLASRQLLITVGTENGHVDAQNFEGMDLDFAVICLIMRILDSVEHGGDLNAAVNAHFSEGDRSA